MKEFEGRNINNKLWESIEQALGAVQKRISGEWNKEDFSSFFIDDNCFIEQNDFINVGKYSFSKEITYLEDRNTKTSKQWNKEKINLESQFKFIFPDFKIPEQSYKPVVNPLLGKDMPAVLNMEDISSKTIDYLDLCKNFGIQPIDSIYQKKISFKFLIKKNDTSLEKPVSIGLNDIGFNRATILIKVVVSIKNELEYCKYVINSDVMSPALFTEYLRSQLSAYFGYNEYPIERINVTKAAPLSFSKIILETSKYASLYPNGQIYFIQKPNLEYMDYVLQTNTLYNSKERKLEGSISDLDVLKNKVIAVDPITAQLVYTDNFAELQKLDLTGFSYLTNERKKIILSYPFENEEVQRMVSICKKIVYQNPNLEIDSKCFDKVPNGTTLKEITEEKYPELVQSFNKLYPFWDSFNIDLLMKLKSKVFLDCILKFNKENVWEEDRNEKERRPGFVNLKKFRKFPISLMKMLYSKEFPEKNRLISFCPAFKEEYFIQEISNLQFNNEIKRPAIICSSTGKVANRLAKVCGSGYNLFILNHDTLMDLKKLFGEKLPEYLAKLPENTIFLINPEIFFDGNLIGNEELRIANKISRRFIVSELLGFIKLDYICVFKEDKYDLKDLIPYNIRILMENAKYRTIFGPLNYNDSLVLDPNTNLSGEENNSDLKQSASVTESEAKYNCGIYKVSNKDFLYAIPEIRQFIHKVKASEDQMEFYRNLVSIGIQNIQNCKDFQDAILTTDLDDKNGISKFYSNYLSQADIFLNAPDSDLFVYKEKFETFRSPNLTSNKIEHIANICSSVLFGGEIESGIKESGKYGKPLIICNNREVRDHIADCLRTNLPPSIEVMKLANCSEEEISKFRSKRNIGVITSDLFYENSILGDISTYIIVQNSWNEDFISEIMDSIFIETINGYGFPMEKVDDKKILIKEPIDVHFVLFDDSLELNKLFLNLDCFIQEKIYEYFNDGNFKKEIAIDYRNPIDYSVDSINVLKGQEFNNSNVMASYKYIIDFEKSQTKSYQEVLSNKILRKMGFRLPLEELLPLAFDKATENEIRGNIGSASFVTFISGMYLPNMEKFNMIPYLNEEYFSDINGNEISYNNAIEKLPKGTIVYSQFGTGTVKEMLENSVILEVPNFQEVVVPLNEIYLAKNYDSFKSYYDSIRNYGDCKLSEAEINISDLKLYQKDEKIDVADNTIDLKLGIINGLYSIYTNEIDNDNIRLENFNFSRFNNIFAIKIGGKDELKHIVEKLRMQGANDSYIHAIQRCFEEFEKGGKFIVPTIFNYFSAGQIKDEKIKAYPVIWNESFFIFLNGNYYQKLGYKLSKKFKVNLIKSTFIEQFEDLKECRFELMKISKVLDVINLQSLLEFFEQNYEKREVLKIQDPNSVDKQIITKKEALDAIREKERKLKQRIKLLREIKNAK